MSKRVLAVLSLAVSSGLSLAACQEKTSPSVAYTTPGWYLERPRAIVARGPEIFAGPFSYDQCEAERRKFDPPTAERLICNRELTKPGYFGAPTGGSGFSRSS
jgi:hypothetical protein